MLINQLEQMPTTIIKFTPYLEGKSPKYDFGIEDENGLVLYENSPIYSKHKRHKNIKIFDIQVGISNPIGKKIFFSPSTTFNFDSLKSLTQTGYFYLFTCSCGIPECAGYEPIYSYIHPEYPNYVFWKINQNSLALPVESHINQDHIIKIEIKQLNQEIQKIKEKTIKFLQKGYVSNSLPKLELRQPRKSIKEGFLHYLDENIFTQATVYKNNIQNIHNTCFSNAFEKTNDVQNAFNLMFDYKKMHFDINGKIYELIISPVSLIHSILNYDFEKIDWFNSENINVQNLIDTIKQIIDNDENNPLDCNKVNELFNSLTKEGIQKIHDMTSYQSFKERIMLDNK